MRAKLIAIYRGIESTFSNLAYVVLIALFLIVLIATMARQLKFNIPLAYTLSGYFLVWLTLLMLPQTFRLGLHIRIDFITRLLPHQVRKVLLFLTDLLSLAICGLLATYSWRYVLNTFKQGTLAAEVIDVPLYLPQLVIPVALTFACFSFVGIIIGQFKELGKGERS
jgi:TRAP-type C4-dicarboxylate transport system permease small subunit